jgi:hypothetical protein
MWKDLPGKEGTPQLLVVSRKIKYGENDIYEVWDEEVLTRKVGQKEIEDWLEQGVPVPL